MELVVPLVVAEIVNVGIAGADKMYVLKGCLILVAFGAAGLAFALTAQFFAARAAVGVSAELKRRLYGKLQSLSYTDLDKLGTSAMITRMTSDAVQVQSGVNMFLRIVLRSPLIVFGAAGMAFFVDVRAALVLVGLIPILGAAIVIIMLASVPLYKKVQEKVDGVQLSVRENLQGARVIRAFCREGEEEELFRSRDTSLKRAQGKAGIVTAVMNPLTYALVDLAVILLLWVGAMRVQAGALEQGDVIALYSYISIILVELVKLAKLVFTVSKAISSEKRIESVLALPDEPDRLISEGEKENADAVRFENVTFTYENGGAPALENIDFAAKAGTTVGILGGTGSGKTTLVNLIPRFYAVRDGKVTVEGKNVNGESAKLLREKIAVVPQHAVLFKGTIRSNLLWGKEDADDEQLLRAVRLAQAEDVLEAKGGLDGEIAQEGRNLSGGQRQRLTIARALVRDPRVLILDDSSSALDYATDARLRAALRTVGCTVFLVSQRTSSVRHADEIIVLDEGRIAGKGTHEELLKTCPLYREIDASQRRENA